MEYFHVLAEQNNNGKMRCIFSDLSKHDLRKKFISPYQRGKKFLCGEELIDPMEITKVKIVLTERTQKTELEELQVRSLEKIDQLNRESNGLVIVSRGYGYEPEHIVEVAKDVSAIYLQRLPGEGTLIQLIVRVLQNPWVITVIGGLLVVFVAWKLGWV